jgi:site-specific DNA-cytosine methylase
VTSKGLDLFCGLGGWSDGLTEAGFEMTGIELNPQIASEYKHKLIVADVCELNPDDFRGFDLIVGSPPCRDFSAQARCAYRNGNPWKVPPDPNGHGLKLVKAFLNFVDVAKPRYWLMENVVGLKKYIDLKPKMEVVIAGNKKRCFWGTFPEFIFVPDRTIRMHYVGKLRSPLNAYIPRYVGRSLGLAISNGHSTKGAH